ncbi:MAG: glycoside hydrolase family 97 catalytic domain-containing protein [Proteiniphilum sp.]|uniref:glycoside hydrolase family 97 protein n=1 Tax=Proteiniphilum sp. TaxID=1926877 RepID=UPI000B2F9B30|nr:glycoside hydrolase family 97 catalytic domain-containing protein [Proteiniphilum sp.]MEA5129545.1 glycoside hydrolase family 97 catalytic domain-containing protein [Proteiniphilum sp.]
MAKKCIFFLLLTLALPYASGQTVLEDTRKELVSPDGNYHFVFYQKQFPNEAKQMYYTLSYQGKMVIEESELGVLIENQFFESALAIPNDTSKIWGENLSLTAMETKAVDETWYPVYGEREKVRDHYNELVLKFQKGGVPETENASAVPAAGQGQAYDKRQYYYMDLVVRAYDQGVAFRYFFPEATNGLFLHIVGEQTQFTLPEGTSAYYERWAQGPYKLLPLNDWKDESERPLTMKLANGLTVALLEAEMVDYARMKFCFTGENRLQASLYGSVDVITPYRTPWRVIMAAEKATELIENNDIVLNLNPKNKIEDTLWIKPGKVIRVSRLTQADAIKCVDFAAERGLQYIHIDAGWYGSEVLISSDATSVAENRDFDMPELVSYAASKGIGVWVYVNQRALVQQLDELLPLYKEWGLKGIKFGFVQVGNQHWSTWLHDAIRKCAEHGIMVDIHDEYRPTGFSRTYPNLLTQEGIKGNEEFPDATHNVTLPFTRFLAGAGDYTICYYDKRIKTTHAHQLAMAVVYYSPLQFLYWYDQPSAYQGEPEIEFFDKVKTVWDDTKVLDGAIGEYITIVRRSGEEWFVGTMTNNDARKVSTSLDFLDTGTKYVANIYTDDDAVQTRTNVRVIRVIVDSKSVLPFQLKPSGGCAVHLIPADNEDLKKYEKI